MDADGLVIRRSNHSWYCIETSCVQSQSDPLLMHGGVQGMVQIQRSVDQALEHLLLVTQEEDLGIHDIQFFLGVFLLHCVQE